MYPVNRGLIHIREKLIYVNDHLYRSPVKKWSSTLPLMIPRSDRGIKERKLCTVDNSAKSRPIDINIIPD
jgi:hypothetical protein